MDLCVPFNTPPAVVKLAMYGERGIGNDMVGGGGGSKGKGGEMVGEMRAAGRRRRRNADMLGTRRCQCFETKRVALVVGVEDLFWSYR